MEGPNEDFLTAKRIIIIAGVLMEESLQHARFTGAPLKENEKSITFYFIPACEHLEKPPGYFEEVPADTERSYYDHPSMEGVRLWLKAITDPRRSDNF